MTTIVFLPQRESAWSDYTVKVTNTLIKAKQECKRNKTRGFVIKFEDYEEPKSLAQLRAVHCLMDLAIPYLEKEHKIKYDRAKAKSFIKSEIGYVRESTPFEIAIMLNCMKIHRDHPDRAQLEEFCKRIPQPESFALATKEKMMDLITQIEAWAAEKGFEGVKIDNKDLIAMLQYYKQ